MDVTARTDGVLSWDCKGYGRGVGEGDGGSGMSTGPSGRTGQSGASACCWASRGAFVAQAVPSKNGNPRVDKKWNYFSKLSVVWLWTSRAQAPEGRVGMQK